MVKHVVKRDGRVVDFNNQKIVAAILKAMDVTDSGEDIVLAAQIADYISKLDKEDMSVEEIQDCVEMELMKSPRKEVAKKYKGECEHECRHSRRHDDEVRFRVNEDLCRRVPSL